MPRRLLVVLLVALCLAAGILALGRGSDAAVQSADRLGGERWYRLMLNDRQVGFMHAFGGRNRLGHWVFGSDLRFVLTPGNTVRVRERLAFAAYPPYPLLRAEQWQQTGEHMEGTLIRRSGDAYQVAALRHAEPEEGRQTHWASVARNSLAWTEAPPSADWRPVTWTYSLPDYMEFEAWLLSEQPPPGSTRAVSTLDFNRRSVVSRVFTVEGRNSTGYLVSHGAPLDSSRIQLDSTLSPQTMTLSGLFELQKVPAAIALAPRTALQTASYFVPVDRPLLNHQNIRELALEIRGDIPPSALWPNLLGDDKRTLHLTANTVSRPAGRRAALEETATFPVSNPRIQRLARKAVTGVGEPAGQVSALTDFVHHYLTYREDAAPTHVMALLDEPSGDCSEYADLFTTLARSLGIPARTVFGLAYAPSTPPAFRFHAWNEVFLDQQWEVVDPTWNQLEVDATHIPLPAGTATALQLLTGGGDVRFVVRKVAYR